MSDPKTLGRALAAAPDPQMARVALARVGEREPARELLSDPVLLEPASLLLGFSTGIADFLVANPDEAGLFADLAPRSHHQLAGEAGADIGSLGPVAGLRRFRRRALYRVAARDLAGGEFEDVVTEITAVAEVCLQAAVDEVGLEGAVIGMGKLGGSELNYSSDVDVLFVHPDAGADAQEDAARKAAAFIALLSEPTAGGVALRVDASLRPEGRAGPLSRSRRAMADYYRRHAATWEKQALLKARPVAGEPAVASELLEELTEVVYPAHLDPTAIEDVRSMKVRIEEYVRASGKEDVEVKRGRGGIRDVEFAVQLLQLVHGRRDPRLRAPGTLAALGALRDQGYVRETDAEALSRSYEFLRTLEHRIQLARDIPGHELPQDDASLRRLARSMRLGSPEDLRREYAEHSGVVRGLHERLFYRPLLEAFAGPAAPAPGVDRPATIELLRGLGFRDPETAYERFDDLVAPETRMGKVLAAVFPVIAPALAMAPDPDAAVIRFERVVERATGAADLLATDPNLARRLSMAVGSSSWLADRLSVRPDALSVIGGDQVADVEGRLMSVGAAYAARELLVPDAGSALADVADASVAEALEEAAPTLPFVVIGLGKLGGRELNFASDLDVVFVYQGDGESDFREASRAAEAALEGIRASGFEADADLRPEGRSGPLARSMTAFLEYWERWGKTWEFQALLKARFVAGDEALGRRFLSAATDFAYPDYLTVDRVGEIRRMRVRMENERVKPPDARRFHFKLGYGGLADVQFAVELSQLRYGRANPEIRRTNTVEALEALARERLMEDGVALSLGEAYVFLSDVKNALEIDRRVRAEALPATADGQLALARRLGYEEYPRQSFLEDYRRITRRARRAMERVFYGEEEIAPP